jgi:hypothetical protein
MDHGDSGGLSSAVRAGKGDFVNEAETLSSGSNAQFERMRQQAAFGNGYALRHAYPQADAPDENFFPLLPEADFLRLTAQPRMAISSPRNLSSPPRELKLKQ